MNQRVSICSYEPVLQYYLFSIPLSFIPSFHCPVNARDLQPRPDMERHAAPVGPDLQEEPAPRRGAPVEEERRGPGVQPPVWLRRAGRWGDGENVQGLENCAWAFPLCSWIPSGYPVSYASILFYYGYCILHVNIILMLRSHTVPTKMWKGNTAEHKTHSSNQWEILIRPNSIKHVQWECPLHNPAVCSLAARPVWLCCRFVMI